MLIMKIPEQLKQSPAVKINGSSGIKRYISCLQRYYPIIRTWESNIPIVSFESSFQNHTFQLFPPNEMADTHISHITDITSYHTLSHFFPQIYHLNHEALPSPPLPGRHGHSLRPLHHRSPHHLPLDGPAAQHPNRPIPTRHRSHRPLQRPRLPQGQGPRRIRLGRRCRKLPLQNPHTPRQADRGRREPAPLEL